MVSPEAIDRDPSPEFTLSEVEGAQDDSIVMIFYLKNTLGGELKKNKLLKNHTTFRIGGLAKFFVMAKNPEEINQAIGWAKEKQINFRVIGGGSNILFSDDGYDGLIVKYFGSEAEFNGDIIECPAGAILASVMNESLNRGLVGLEWAAGIPGTIGGGVHNNCGAYGSEMADIVSAVSVLRDDEVIELSKDQCGFGYRESVFKNSPPVVIPTEAPFGKLRMNSGRVEGSLDNESDSSARSAPNGASLGRNDNKKDIILSVKIKLKPATPAEIAQAKEKISKILAERKPKFSGLSAGSTFGNIIMSEEEIKKFKAKHLELPERFVGYKKIPAAWLIEQCGLKGRSVGGAKVSESHAGIIINTGDATAKDVIMLISIIKQKVRSKFNLQLMEEIEYIGF